MIDDLWIFESYKLHESFGRLRIVFNMYGTRFSHLPPSRQRLLISSDDVVAAFDLAQLYLSVSVYCGN